MRPGLLRRQLAKNRSVLSASFGRVEEEVEAKRTGKERERQLIIAPLSDAARYRQTAAAAFFCELSKMKRGRERVN
jgi:hypothetical protein